MDYYKTSLVFLILRVAEFFSQFVFIVSLSKTSIKLKKILSATLIFSLIFEFTKLFLPQYLTSVSAMIIIILTLIFIIKINYKKAILLSIENGLLVAIIDCIVSIILLKIFQLDSFSKLSQNNNMVCCGKIIIILTTLLISFFISKNNRNIINIKKSTNLITLIITALLLFPNLIMILYYYDNKPLPLTIIIINIIAIILTFLVSIYNTQRGIKLVQAEEELLTEKTYNNTLRELVDSLRTFKHDYNNTLQTMNGYIFIKDMDGLTEYFNQVLAESKAIVTLDRLNPELFKNPSLFGLVTAKFEYARKNDINMNFEIYADLDNLAIKDYDFTRILGIFLDNAIEAAIGSEKKIVNFYVVERNNKVTIEISNSFSGTGLKISDIYKKGVSSKGDNRGLGLYKVKDILSKYPNIIGETNISNGIFMQRLIIERENIRKINTVK